MHATLYSLCSHTPYACSSAATLSVACLLSLVAVRLAMQLLNMWLALSRACHFYASCSSCIDACHLDLILCTPRACVHATCHSTVQARPAHSHACMHACLTLLHTTPTFPFVHNLACRTRRCCLTLPASSSSCGCTSSVLHGGKQQQPAASQLLQQDMQRAASTQASSITTDLASRRRCSCQHGRSSRRR